MEASETDAQEWEKLLDYSYFKDKDIPQILVFDLEDSKVVELFSDCNHDISRFDKNKLIVWLWHGKDANSQNPANGRRLWKLYTVWEVDDHNSWDALSWWEKELFHTLKKSKLWILYNRVEWKTDAMNWRPIYKKESKVAMSIRAIFGK